MASRAARSIFVGFFCTATLVVVGCTQLLGDFEIGDAGSASVDASSTDTAVGQRDSTTPGDSTLADNFTPTDVVQPPTCGQISQLCCATGTACTSGSCCGGNCIDTTMAPKNCGACGHDCLSSGCANGLCIPTVLASFGGTDPSALQVDNRSVYWGQINGNNAYVASCDKVNGCGNKPAILFNANFIGDVVLDNQGSVYASDFNTAVIDKCAIGGCSGAATQFPLSEAGGLDIFGNALLAGGFDKNGSRLQQTALDGTNLILIGQDGNTVFVTDVVADLNGAYVFWTESQQVRVGKMGVATSGNTFASTLAGQNAETIAIDKNNVYWQEQDSTGITSIYGCPVGFSCANRTPMATKQHMGIRLGDLASDTTNLYWTAQDNMGHIALYKCAAAGGCGLNPTPIAVVPSASNLGGVAVDTQYVYFVVEGGGVTTVYRAAK